MYEIYLTQICLNYFRKQSIIYLYFIKQGSLTSQLSELILLSNAYTVLFCSINEGNRY